MYYRVKEVSQLTGLSVRRLHHYDKINLLKPDHVTEAGYREYSEDNLADLQQIMFLRELDFPLETIGTLLVNGASDRIQMLARQKSLLEEKISRLQKIITTIDLTQERIHKGEAMTNEERFDSFDMKAIEAHKAKYAQEVEERWGGTEAYAQSKARTDVYGPEDFKRITEATNKTYQEIVSLMDKDVSDDRVQTLVASLRQGITDNFYDCTPEIFAGLGEMYVADPRFEKSLNKEGEGFAAYLSKAIAYYIDHL